MVGEIGEWRESPKEVRGTPVGPPGKPSPPPAVPPGEGGGIGASSLPLSLSL